MSSFLGDTTVEDNNFSTHAASVTTTFANISSNRHKRRTTFLTSLENSTSKNSSKIEETRGSFSSIN